MLTQSIASKEVLLQEKQNLLAQRDTVMKGLAATAQTIQSCKELKEKISTLEHCPLCLQDVAHAHKESITLQQDEKYRVAESQHSMHTEQENVITKRLLDLETELTILLDQEKKLFLQKSALQALETYEAEYVQKRMILQSTFELLSTVEQELKTLGETDWSLKEAEVQKFEEMLNKIRAYENSLKEKAFLERSLLDKKADIQTLILENIDILEKERVLSHQLLKKRTILEKYAALDELFTKEKQSYEHIASLDKEIHLKSTALLSERKMKEEYLSDTEKNLSSCIQARDQVEKNKQFMHWFVELFQPLMLTIEKAVLLKIYHEFNAYFTEWFSILIDDDMIVARLDDTFSPYVEQNGYETSFENLSGGEKTAVALAYRLALNKVINTFMVTITTKDFLILDEPTDGFSTEQLDKMRDVLDQLDLKQILIVSHEHKIEAYVEHVLQIVKDGHVSSVLS